MEKKTATIRFKLNGDSKTMDVAADISVLHLLRDELDLKGTKEGCGMGECGACTIVVDGRAVNACLMFAPQLDGRDVLTIEGLQGKDGLHALQQSFVEHHGVQCGFCTPGVLMSAHALLQENSQASRDDIVKAISGNLCRCTGYQNMVTAIEAARDRRS
jgi:carbon-monoxide dehydrogenase small subunit